METKLFDQIDIGDIQEMIFPIVKSLTGFDIQGVVSDKSVALEIAGDELIAIGNFVKLCAQSVSDGILTSDELNGLVAAAPDVKSAYAQILELFRTQPKPE